jgi:hypothetical membrane protein
MTETIVRSAGLTAGERSRRVVGLATIGGSLAFVSAGLIWLSRIGDPSVQYVSQLGATGMPTAPLFNSALLLLGIAAVLVDRALLHGSNPYVAGWPVSATLVVCGACFALASVVTCSPGCPVPFTPGALPQDLIHISAAVLGFVLAIVAMAQVALLRRRPWMRATSLATLAAVGLSSFSGAMLALFRGDTVLGGNLEFTAATLAIAWFGIFGMHVAVDHRVIPSPGAERRRGAPSAGSTVTS